MYNELFNFTVHTFHAGVLLLLSFLFMGFLFSSFMQVREQMAETEFDPDEVMVGSEFQLYLVVASHFDVL